MAAGHRHGNVVDGTAYDENNVGIEYARIDGGPSNPGYLTDANSSILLEGVTFADNHYATWYGNMNLAVPEGLTAYVVTDVVNGGTTILAVDYIPADVGVLLYSDTPRDEVTTIRHPGERAVTTSMLTGSLEPMVVTSGYVLTDDKFQLVQSETTLEPHRCYLHLDDMTDAPEELTIGSGDIGTFIDDINADKQRNSQRYNLLGQPVRPDYKGVVIENGKVILVK